LHSAVGALPQKRTTHTISNNLLSDFQDSKGQSILLNKLKNASVSNPFLVGGLDLSFFLNVIKRPYVFTQSLLIMAQKKVKNWSLKVQNYVKSKFRTKPDFWVVGKPNL